MFVVMIVIKTPKLKYIHIQLVEGINFTHGFAESL